MPARLPRSSGLVAAGVLAVLAALVYGRYVMHAPLSLDDFSLRSQAHFNSFGAVVSQLIHQDARRPVAAVYFAALFTIFGSHPVQLVAASIVVHWFVAVLLFLLLRELGLAWPAAAVIGALYLLFPADDSLWLWSTASQISFAVGCVLLGTLVNLRAVGRGDVGAGPARRAGGGRGRRDVQGILMRTVGLMLLAAGILDYETVAPAALLSGALYRTRLDPRQTLRAWGVDVLVLVAVIVIFTFHAVPILHGGDNHAVQSLSAIRVHTQRTAAQAVVLLARVLFPFGTPSAALVIACAVIALVVGHTVVARRGEETDRHVLRRWFAAGAAGIVVVAVGYLFELPAGIYYIPLQTGNGNRTNGASAIGYVLVACCLIVTVAVALVPSHRDPARVQRIGPASRFRFLGRFGPAGSVGRAVVVAALSLFLALGYYRGVHRDEQAREQASRLQEAVLASLREHVGVPAPRTLILTARAPAQTAEGIPVFDASWDLSGAIQLLWRDPTLRAFSIVPGRKVSCEASGLLIFGGDPSPYRAKYPATLVDFRSGHVDVVRGAAACAQSAAGP